MNTTTRTIPITYTTYVGFDSFIGNHPIKFPSDTSFDYILMYCKVNKISGFYKNGRGQYYIKSQRYSKTDLINNLKDVSNKYKYQIFYILD